MQVSPNKIQPTILVVDDIPTNIQVLFELLEDSGYRVAIAKSGEMVLQLLQNLQPNLILLDVMMPGIDGFETCQRLKNNPTTQNIPVIFMTALSDPVDKVKGLKLGAVDYITKPIQYEEVLARIDVHLELQSLRQNLEAQIKNRTAELQEALRIFEQTQLQMIQSEKMSSLGQLVASVAHEINNPIGFLNGSINNAKDYAQHLLEHLALYQQYYPHPVPSIQDHAKDIDLEFLLEDLPKLLNSMEVATDRITAISNSLRTFSRADTEYKVSANLHDGIDSTIMILKYRLKANEYRPDIEVIQDYGYLPSIDCFPGQLNQVFMNILANAIDMFDEMAHTKSFAELKATPQQITIRTTIDANQVQIEIFDNGKGMTEEVKAQIFDHLFTTKGVGKGTGLGLAIAKQIVVEKHGGSLEVQSTLGEGTKFCIRLPIGG